MRHKLLAPNGKSYTMAQLDRLNIKQVFDMLTDLGVADKSLYTEFKRLNRAPSRRRSRSYSRSPKTRYVYVKPRSPRRRYIVIRSRSPSRRSPRRSPRRAQPPVGSCPYHTGDPIGCRNAGCFWTGYSCVSP